MNSLRVAGLGAVALTLSLLCGCSQNSSDNGKIKVGFVTNNADPFWTIAQHGTEKAAREFDVECIVRKPQGDVSDQQKEIDSLVNQGVKALSVSVIDPENQAPYLNEISRKVKLFTQDNDTVQDDPKLKTERLCYIGTNNYEAGRAAGQLVQEALPDGGEIAIFVGDLSGLNAQQRKQGVLDQLAGLKNAKGRDFGKYHLFADVYTDQPEAGQKCKSNALNAITQLQEQINAGKPVCFIGLWAYNPPAILDAVRDKKVVGKVIIVGFDENPATLEGIEDGSVVGTIVQQPFEFGYQSVRLMAAVARGDRSVIPANGRLDVPHFVVTREGKDRSSPATKELPKLETQGKTAAFWKKDLEEKTGAK